MRRGAGRAPSRCAGIGSWRSARSARSCERVGGAPPVLSGACIVPGFQDAHIHAAFAGREPPQREPRRSALQGRVPRAHRDVRARAPGPALDRRRRVVQRRLRRRRVAAPRGPRRRRAGPSRVPDEHGHARRVGEHRSAGPRRHRRLVARPVGRVHRPRPGGVPERVPAGGGGLFVLGRRGAARPAAGPDGVDQGRPARAPRTGDHRMAGRVGRARPAPRVPSGGRRGRSHGEGRDGPVVGSASRPGADRGPARGTLVGQRRQRPRDHGEDHARWLPRELHRVVARSVRRRLRPGSRPRHPVRRRGGAPRRGDATRRAGLPGTPARARRPGGPGRPRRRRGRAPRERHERSPAPHRAPPAARSCRRPAPATARRDREHPAVLGAARSDDRDDDEAARGRARRAPVSDRGPGPQRRRPVSRQRLAGQHAEPVPGDGGRGDPAGRRRPGRRAARRGAADRPADRPRRVHTRLGAT